MKVSLFINVSRTKPEQRVQSYFITPEKEKKVNRILQIVSLTFKFTDLMVMHTSRLAAAGLFITPAGGEEGEAAVRALGHLD